MKVHEKSFYFVRHGETDFNLRQILTSEEDVSLNERGIQQAKSIQLIIEKLPIKTICVSPLKRAQETKAILAERLACPTIIIENLRECSGDVWMRMTAGEGMLIPASYCSDVEYFFRRTIQGINEALSYPGPVLIVAHGGIHWALCHHLSIQHEKKIGNCIPVHFDANPLEGWKATCLSAKK
ncbi:histidine phosphatase family protein [Candidatus Protochlamydia phocaeensis]|uniref:histidine phosphatase family protein n=1 Tax=Candidatus Protochlamydia phocaeensis TaxID=1414722 RepID=UPI000838DBF0|nr:histidine phosphatase family protein [Candidatus Protochlamydia phocaeensis]